MPIIPFWIYNPSILINTKYILAFIPKSTTTYEENLNALTRGIILITLLGTFLFSSIRFLLVGIFSISIICLYYQINKELYKQTHIENFIANNNINTDNTLLSQNPVNKDGIKAHDTNVSPHQNFDAALDKFLYHHKVDSA